MLSCASMPHLPNITNQLTSKELFDAFKAQLARDFDQSNFQSDFVAALEPDYQRIHEKIMHELQQNEKRADFNLMHLLYRVDISEAQLKRYLSESKGEGHFHVIAELIIKRVLQKVVIRRYYKNHDKL
jgi:disulfide oxidoreductase YuzD